MLTPDRPTREIPSAHDLPARVSVKPPRGIHADHFAFMRAVAQGVSAEKAWSTYLEHVEGLANRVQIRAVLRWLNEEFAAAARRGGRHGVAKLILFDSRRLVAEDAPPAPTLDEFAATIGGDWGEKELIEMYVAEYGGSAKQRQDPRHAKKQRLIKRRLEEIERLRISIVMKPRAMDPIAAWFKESWSAALEAHGIVRLGELIAWMNRKGPTWWRPVRGIGKDKAASIEKWCVTHATEIGRSVAPYVVEAPGAGQLVQHDGPSFGIRPFEKLVIPEQLNGANGAHRRRDGVCLLRGQNDVAAISEWIRTKSSFDAVGGGGSAEMEGLEFVRLNNTQRAYLSAAERLLLWAVHVAKKPLSSLTVADCSAYAQFLLAPSPTPHWCTERVHSRTSPLWRPFVGEGGLAPSSWRNQIVILRSLYAFWVKNGYITGNPWESISIPKHLQARRIQTNRSLSQEHWDKVQAYLLNLPDCEQTLRLRALLALLYSTGMRLAEVAAAKAGQLQEIVAPARAGKAGRPRWELEVTGKGGKLRKAYPPAAAVSEIERHLAARGLEDKINAPGNREAYLIGRDRYAGDVGRPRNIPAPAYDPSGGLTPNAIYKMLKRFFAECATSVEKADPEGAERIRDASTHWLRHTHGSHSLARGGNIKRLQQRLGHASLATTTIYSTAEDEEMADEAEALFGATGARPDTVLA